MSQTRRKTRKQRKLNPPLLNKNQRRILTYIPMTMTKTLLAKASPLSWKNMRMMKSRQPPLKHKK
jgi:hypothetical protein